MTRLLLILSVLGPAGTAQVQHSILQIDPSRTRVEFTLGATMHTVRGTFGVKGGEIRFDPSSGVATGEVVVDAASGESGNGARDSRMHENILESHKYPQIVFRPDHFEGKLSPDGVSDLQVHGIFSIHGADHEITAPVRVEASPDQLSATLHFSVPYVKWGLKNPSTLFLRVKDTVEIDIHAAGHVTGAVQR